MTTQPPPGFILDTEPSTSRALPGLPPGFELDQLEVVTPEQAGPRPQTRVTVGRGVPGAGAPDGNSRDGAVGKLDSAVRGAADILSFGLADEMAAGADALFNPIFGTGQDGGDIGERYERNLVAQRGVDEADAKERGGYRLAGQLTGGVAGGAGLTRSGLSLGANAIESGARLPSVIGRSMVEGGYLSGAHGFGSGEDGLGDRALDATKGVASGLALGAAAPIAITGVTAAAQPLLAPVLSRLNPQSYTNAALAQGLTRAGTTADEVAAQLQAAQEAGQGVFNVADAMGNAGQRMLSTAARTPHEARQGLVEALQSRQAGQGRRITNALAEGFDAPDTAMQRVSTLTQARDDAADLAYGASRRGAGAVDVSGALARIDDVLSPGSTRLLSLQGEIPADSVAGVLARARSMLTDGRSNLTDFSAVHRVKLDLDDLIESASRRGAGNQARLLRGVRNELDQALERASAPYAGARDAYRVSSREIDAVDLGRKAAQRGRSEDTTRHFASLTPGEQAAFRAGYADEMIRQTQGAAVGVNKARPLINDATAVEFPAFSAPGQADQLGERLAREARMFETGQAATGNSKTADNVADMLDMRQFDPAILSDLAKGNWTRPLTAAAGRIINEAQGHSPTVMERLTRALMETDPDAARRMLDTAATRNLASDKRRALINALLTNAGAAGAGRLASP